MDIETLRLTSHGPVPNNPRLPVLLYRRALTPGSEDLAEAFETAFRANGWTGTWRNGIFDYHHYHAGAHEVLGIAAGSARLALGGPGGAIVEVVAGDMAVLPAGTGHRRLEASAEFQVVGGYPPGQSADLRCEAPDEAALRSIRNLALPKTDPLGGIDGPLRRFWG